LKKETYGFQSHLSPEFPSQVIIDVTEHCNLACIHCPHPKFSKSKIWKGRHLDVQLHKKIIEEVASDGKGVCQYIRYTANGEPLIHPNFIKMIEYAGKKLTETSINVTTNGKILTEKRAKSLLDAGVDVFDISLDAFTPTTYAKVRIKGDLDRTKANVLRLWKLKQEGGYKSKLVVSFVVQPQNQHEAEEFEKFWKEIGIDYVVMRKLHSSGGSKSDLVKVESVRYPCLYPWERITIAPDGKLHFCPQDWVHGSEIDDFRNVTIKEVWQGEFMKHLREAHLNNNFSCYNFCANCPDWFTTKWPSAGRSYSNMMKELVPNDLIEE